MEEKILFKCAACEQKYSINTKYAGKQMDCPACKKKMVVPVVLETEYLENLKHHYNLGLYYNSERNYEKAIVECYKAIELFPGYLGDVTREYITLSYGIRADSYRAMEEHEKSIADYTKAIEMTAQKNKAQFHWNRGDVYYEQGDCQKAIDDYDKAIDISPEFLSESPSRAEFYEKIKEIDNEIPKTIHIEEVTTPKDVRHIMVGLDFGTSSTKVLYRDYEKGARGEVFPIFFTHDIPKYSEFLLPSVVSFYNDRLFFGKEPLPDKDSFLSLKSCLGCLGGAFQDTCPQNKKRKDCIQIENDNKESFSKKFLAALYLAYVVNEVYKVLDAKYGKEFDLKLICNMGIPVAYYQNPECKKLFSDIFASAEYMKGNIRQGIFTQEALQHCLQAFSDIKEIPDNQKNTNVLEETYAPIFSDLLQPSYQGAGKHVIVDVGAGTTDIVVFDFPEINFKNGLPVIPTLDPESFSVGGDNIDEKILRNFENDECFQNNRNSLLYAIRTAKHNAEKNNNFNFELEGESYSVDIKKYKKASSEVADKIYESYRATAYKAYQKRKKESEWEKMTLYRIGGGSQIQSISNILKTPLPLNYKDMVLNLGNLEAPEELKADSGYDLSWVTENYSFFSVAFGLTLFPQTWPKIIPSNEVKPLKKPEKVARPDRDELYPK